MAGGIPTGSDPDYLTPHPYSVMGAGFAALKNRDEATVRAELESQVKNNQGLKSLSDSVFDGIDPSLGLVGGVVEAFLSRIIGSIQSFDPGLSDGPTVQFLSRLETYFTNFRNFLNNIDFLDGEFHPLQAFNTFIGSLDIEGAGLLNGVLDGIDLEPGALMRELNNRISDALEDRPLVGEIVEPVTGVMQQIDGLADHFQNARDLWGEGLDLNLAPGDFNPLDVLHGFMSNRVMPTDQFNNLLSLFGDALPNINMDPDVFDPGGVIDYFVENRLKPTGKLAELVDGIIPDERIGELDAAKITTGIISEAVTTIGDLRDNLVNGLLGGFNGFGFSNTDANQKATELAQTAMAAASAASAAQEQLAAQEQSQTSNGTNFRTTFGGSDGSNLNSSDWNPYNGNVVIRGSGFMGVKGGSAEGTYPTTCLHSCVTDDQMVSMVLGDQGGSTGAPLRVLWHLPTNSSTLGGACLSITKESIKFGHLSAADVFTQIGPTYSAGIGQGTRIDAYNVGNLFIVKINGVARISGTDSGGLITLSNRFGAVRMARKVDNGWFGTSFTYDCFRLSSFGLSDYSSVTEIAVDAWKISRSDTTNVGHAVANGSAALLPTGFFSFTDYVDGASVTTLSTGVVTIATSGLYELSCSIVATATIRQSGATLTTRVASPWALAVNGTQATGAAAAGAPITVYLNAGDTVQPMVVAVGPTLSSVDDPSTSGVVMGYEFGIVSVRGFAHFSGRQIGTA